MRLRTRVVRGACCGVVGAWALIGGPAAVLAGDARPDPHTEARPELQPEMRLSVREAYDSNVYLQNSGPLGGRGSWVTTVTPTLGLTWKPGESAARSASGSTAIPATSPLTLSVSYSPSRVTFHDEPGESYWDHPIKSELSLTAGRWTAGWTGLLRLIDGDGELPRYTEQGGLPAAGAPAVRDRRDQTLFRSGVKAQYTSDGWFVRPVAAGFVQDFHIEHDPTPGFCNFADRSDFNVGADLGLAAVAAPNLTWVTAGYRIGHQSQDTTFDSPIHYANDYQRFLLGVEGKPTRWLKLAAQAGPDVRTYTADVPDTFDRDQVEFFFDVSATLTPSPADEITLTLRRFDQPGAGGRSVYADATYAVCYKRKLTSTLTGSAGLKAYNTDFEYPAKKRDDWVYTADLSLGYTLTSHWAFEAGYLFEAGRSNVPDTPGREYDRHLMFVGVAWQY